jgi:hypothetical protein
MSAPAINLRLEQLLTEQNNVSKSLGFLFDRHCTTGSEPTTPRRRGLVDRCVSEIGPSQLMT